MSRINRSIRVGIVGAVSLLVTAYPVYAAVAAPAPTLQNAVSPAVIISEFQTNGGSASQEFIELYNNTDQEIVFGDGMAAGIDGQQPQLWKIQFFNSSAAKSGTPMWSTALTASNSIALSGTVAAHDYFLIASTGYLPEAVEPDMSYAASSSHLMADTGGALQLLRIDAAGNSMTAHDRIMWLAQSTGSIMPTGVMASPSSGKSRQRIPNDNLEYLSADNGLTDFGIDDTITPLDAWVAPRIEPEPIPLPEADVPVGDVGTQPDPVVSGPAINQGLSTPGITELLPNPAAPLTDADDEYIELYNPNTSAYDLEGYKLEVGTTTLRTYTFPAGTVLQPLGYQAFYSLQTGLALSNSGGQARLKTADSQVLSETVAYKTAADGEAWTYADGAWQWSASATPGLANIVALPATAATAKTAKTTKASESKAAKTIKAATAKKAATKTATKAKSAKAKTTTKKAAKKKTATVKTAASVMPEKPKPPIHIGILVAVVSVAVLYGLYEYRHDIALKFRQLGRNRRPGLTDRLAPAGR